MWGAMELVSCGGQSPRLNPWGTRGSVTRGTRVLVLGVLGVLSLGVLGVLEVLVLEVYCY